MQQRSGSNSRRPTVISQQRKSPQQNQTLRTQSVQSNNQLPLDTRRLSNEINPPEILSAHDSQLRRKKQQKDKSKENRTLRLTGDVDLGKNIFKKNKQMRTNRKKNDPKSSVTASTIPSTILSPTTTTTTTTTTTESPNSISQNYQVNHHRHNHYNSNNDVNNRRMEENSRRENTYRNQQQSYTTASPIMTANSGNAFNPTTESTASKLSDKVTFVRLFSPGCNHVIFET